MKLSDLSEAFLSRFSTKDRYGDPVSGEIFKNPTHKELNYVKSKFAVDDSDVPAFLHLETGDLFIFYPYLLHYSILETGKMPANSIGIRMYHDKTDCEVYVSDSAKRTTWDHNPEILAAIMKSYVSKLFNIVEVSYYDEAISGKWEDLDQEDNS